jgi:hypothetical protein
VTVQVPSLGWSQFALQRHLPGGGHAYFDGPPDDLLELVRQNWHRRRPGTGRQDLTEVVVVPIPPARCVCNTVRLSETTPLHVSFERRQPGEDGYAKVTATGEREPARHAAVVLYSAETLLANGGARSGDWEWEVVCLVVGPRQDEPMNPLTMARNQLARPGGTPCQYSAQQFAEAIDYWSQRAPYHDPCPEKSSDSHQ